MVNISSKINKLLIFIVLLMCSASIITTYKTENVTAAKTKRNTVIYDTPDWQYISRMPEKYLQDTDKMLFKRLPSTKEGTRPIILKKVANKEIVDSQSMVFFTKNVNVEVYQNLKRRYSTNIEDNKTKTSGLSMWNFVDFKNKLKFDDKVYIVLYTIEGPKEDTLDQMLHQDQNYPYDIFIANKNDFIHFLIHKDFFPLIISMLTFMFAIVIFIVGLVLNKKLEDNIYLYFLGFTILFSARFVFTFTGVIQSLVSNPSILSLQLNLMLVITTIGISAYLGSLNNIKFKPIFDITVVFNLIVLGIETFSIVKKQSIFLYETFQPANINYFLIALQIGCILWQNKKYNDEIKEILLTYLMYLPIVATSFLKTNMLLDNFSATESVILLVIFLSLTTKEIKKYSNLYHRRTLINKYKGEAFMDSMTQMQNRVAFKEEIDSHKENLSRLAIVSFDVDNLKYVNDNFGHMTGDDLIKTITQYIKKIYSDASCYRMGGDEFLAILKDTTAKDLLQRKYDLIEILEIMSLIKNYPLSVSIGYAIYDPSKDTNFDSLVSRSDKAMYEDKAKKKANKEIHAR